MSELHEISTRRPGGGPAPAGEAAIDPVCGMTVDTTAGKPTHEHAGRVYHFCSAGCRTKFAADPGRYLEPARREAAAAAEAASAGKGTLYTCPMHPEIVQEGPGSCPICGMALEPMGPPVRDVGPNPELVDFSQRLKVGAALTVPILVLAMGAHVGLPVQSWLGPRLAQWLELVLATPVMLWCGAPIFERGWQSIRNASPNMWTLISIGVGAAYLYSLVAALAPWAFPSELRGAGGTVGVYFEADGPSRRSCAGRVARSASTSRPPP